MSKMSNINLELQEYANGLGYSTVQEALDDGYNAVQDLVTGEWNLQRVDMAQEQEKAHEAWLKEKEKTLKTLVNLLNIYSEYGRQMGKTTQQYELVKALNDAIRFIEGVKHE